MRNQYVSDMKVPEFDVYQIAFRPEVPVTNCVFLHWQGVFGVLGIPSALVIVVGLMLREPHVHSVGYRRVR